MSPRSSKAIVRPSGSAATAIHVPSFTLNGIGRCASAVRAQIAEASSGQQVKTERMVAMAERTTRPVAVEDRLLVCIVERTRHFAGDAGAVISAS